MRARTVALGWLLGLSSGCTITATSGDADQGPSNTCEVDADCSEGNCSGGICQTLTGELESLLFEVTPPSDYSLPHLPFVTHLENVPTTGGDMPIELARSGHITGRLTLAAGTECRPTFDIPSSSDGLTLPVTIRLTPRESLLGLPSQVYFAQTKVPGAAGFGLTPQGEYVFELRVPAGEYDVYAVLPRQQAGCQVPPQLFRQNIAAGEIELTYTVSATQSLTLDIRWPEAAGRNLDGWIADIIEPLGGNVISTEFVLGSPLKVSASALQYSVPLDYSTVAEPSEGEDVAQSADLVRLRPPPGVIAPTVFLDRSGLGLFAREPGAPVVVNGFTRYPLAVEVEGQLTRLDDGKPVRGHVTLVSTEIQGVDTGIVASFQTTVDVGADGVFSLQVPPGKYRVYAVPPLGEVPLSGAEAPLSAVEVSWEIPADVPFQAGKLVELPSSTEVTGQTSLPGAQVVAVPSPRSILPFQQAIGAVDFAPRAGPGVVDQTGHFVVHVEPGHFDFFIRPPESLGFGWSVRPGVEVGREDEDLGRVPLPPPSVVTGSVVVVLGDMASNRLQVPSALIRAYAYLDKDLAYTKDPQLARSVIQVAETRSDETGAFKLLLPSSIAAPK